MKTQPISFSLFLLLLVSLAAGAEPQGQPVARVQTIAGAGNLFYSDAGPWFRAYAEMDSYKGQHLKTDKASMATLAFKLGGLVNIDRGTEIEIIADRDVKIVGDTLELKSGSLWARVKKQKSTLRIKTAGGVMGIKGTEFVVQVDGGQTRLSLLEGSVEVEPDQGEAYMAEPGERVTFGSGRDLEAQLLGTEALLRDLEVELGETFIDLRRNLEQVEQSLRETEPIVRSAMADARAGMEQAEAGLDEARRALIEAGLMGGDSTSSNGGGASQPSPLAQSMEVRIVSGRPRLLFEKLEAPEYAVMLTRGDSFEQSIDWMTRTTQTSVDYPADARPLAAGRYRWRVLLLDDQGRSSGTAYESFFTLGGPDQP